MRVEGERQGKKMVGLACDVSWRKRQMRTECSLQNKQAASGPRVSEFAKQEPVEDREVKHKAKRRRTRRKKEEGKTGSAEPGRLRGRDCGMPTRDHAGVGLVAADLGTRLLRSRCGRPSR